MTPFRKYALFSAWLVSLLGFSISYYIGEILQMEPCHLCWYQRIALFPLVIILGIGAYRDDRKIVIYTLPLVAIGAFFAFYQALGQRFPILLGNRVCGYVDDCGIPVFNLFGWITFPILSLLGFALIALFLIFAYKKPSPK